MLSRLEWKVLHSVGMSGRVQRERKLYSGMRDAVISNHDEMGIDPFFEDSSSGAWKCQCLHGYDGRSCQVPLETECGDKVDNDGGN